MPPYRPTTDSSDSDSDGDAPEAVSLSKSKESARKHEKDFKKFEAEHNTKKRQKNREKDRRLKEQSTQSKGKKAATQAEVDAVEDDDEQEDAEGTGDDSEMEEIEDTSNHLPDHIFESAFSESSAKPKPSTQSGKATALTKKVSSGSRQRRKKKNTPKDLIIGNRRIHTLPDTTNVSLPPSTSVLPSAKIRKFLNRTLSMKGDKRTAQKKGWERRPAHLGVLKSFAPPSHFVRNGS